MRADRLHTPLILGALVFLAAASGCGGPSGDGTPELRISFSRLALTDAPTSARVVFHPSDRSCSQIKMKPTVAGIKEASVSLGADQQSAGAVISTKIDLIPADTYTVAVLALKDNGNVVGFGCVEMIVIENGKRTPIAIDVQ